MKNSSKNNQEWGVLCVWCLVLHRWMHFICVMYSVLILSPLCKCYHPSEDVKCLGGSPKPNEWPKNVSIASDSMEGGRTGLRRWRWKCENGVACCVRVRLGKFPRYLGISPDSQTFRRVWERVESSPKPPSSYNLNDWSEDQETRLFSSNNIFTAAMDARGARDGRVHHEAKSSRAVSRPPSRPRSSSSSS